jgi:hypothetical protein
MAKTKLSGHYWKPGMVIVTYEKSLPDQKFVHFNDTFL